MICPIHRRDDGYRPTQPDGTMFRAREDLRHAWAVFGRALAEPFLRLVDRFIGGR